MRTDRQLSVKVSHIEWENICSTVYALMLGHKQTEGQTQSSYVTGTLRPWGKGPWHPLYWRLAGHHSRSGRCGEKKNILPLPGTEPRTSFLQLIVIPTELFRLYPSKLLGTNRSIQNAKVQRIQMEIVHSGTDGILLVACSHTIFRCNCTIYWQSRRKEKNKNKMNKNSKERKYRRGTRFVGATIVKDKVHNN